MFPDFGSQLMLFARLMLAVTISAVATAIVLGVLLWLAS